MKLIYKILIRLTPALTILLAIWGYLFYVAIIDEINDEVDDSLEDYSENIIIRALSGQKLPSRTDGTNNSYYLTAVSEEYANTTPHILYLDKTIYTPEKKEYEPARILITIFKNSEGNYFELTVSTPSIEKEDLRDAILNWIILLYFVLLVTLLSINIWVLHKCMQPLYILLGWLDNYTVDKGESLPQLHTSITEFQKLHTAAQKTIERNQIIYEQQKQFIGNASHELQTPLAICQNRLEILAEQDGTTEEQLQEITRIQDTLSYIIRLNKSLLFLSKIENGQFHDKQEICFNQLIRRQLEDYQEIYAYKNITVNIEENGELKRVMNPTLATSLITNLLKNTYVHNFPQGIIHIRITPQSLIFCNSGDPEPLDETQIFQRFYQGKTQRQGSSGLGLSITHAICNLYHIHIQYKYEGLHCFELFFK